MQTATTDQSAQADLSLCWAHRFCHVAAQLSSGQVQNFIHNLSYLPVLNCETAERVTGKPHYFWRLSTKLILMTGWVDRHSSRSMTKLKNDVGPANTQISLGIHPVWLVFTVHMKKPCMKKPCVLSYQLSPQSADAQADLRLFCAHMQFCWFSPTAGYFCIHLLSQQNRHTEWIKLYNFDHRELLCCHVKPRNKIIIIPWAQCWAVSPVTAACGGHVPRYSSPPHHPPSLETLLYLKIHNKLQLSQLMRLWYLPHRWLAKAQVSLRKCAVSPEPSLFAHMKYGSRRRVPPKIRHLDPLDGCAWVFKKWVYEGRKLPFCHEAAHFGSTTIGRIYDRNLHWTCEEHQSLRMLLHWIPVCPTKI